MRERGLLRTRIFILLAVVAAVASSASAFAGEKLGDGGKVRLGYNSFGTNSFPPFIIQKFALDKKYGFEFEGVTMATTQAMITAFQSGGIDIGMLGWNDLARMKTAGVNVVGVAPFLAWGADFVVVTKESPIQNIGDFKGKKIGSFGRTSLNSLAIRTVAKKVYHLDLDKDATIQEGSTNLLWGLLEQGQLDATEMFNSLTPAMVATGKFRVLTQITGILDQLGLPRSAYLLYTANGDFAAAHPGNVKAFLAAYREAIEILNKDDSVWLEHGHEMKMGDEAIVLFRDEARADIKSAFSPTSEADIRKTFDFLLANAGAEVLGITQLPDKFMTLDYQ